jgi:hypothetical protein
MVALAMLASGMSLPQLYYFLQEHGPNAALGREPYNAYWMVSENHGSTLPLSENHLDISIQNLAVAAIPG